MLNFCSLNYSVKIESHNERRATAAGDQKPELSFFFPPSLRTMRIYCIFSRVQTMHPHAVPAGSFTCVVWFMKFPTVPILLPELHGLSLKQMLSVAHDVLQLQLQDASGEGEHSKGH